MAWHQAHFSQRTVNQKSAAARLASAVKHDGGRMAQVRDCWRWGAGLWPPPQPERAQSSFADATSMTWDGVLTGIFLGCCCSRSLYAVFLSPGCETFLICKASRAVHFGRGPRCPAAGDGGMAGARPVSRAKCGSRYFFDLSFGVSCVFLRSYLEPGMVGPRSIAGSVPPF